MSELHDNINKEKKIDELVVQEAPAEKTTPVYDLLQTQGPITVNESDRLASFMNNQMILSLKRTEVDSILIQSRISKLSTKDVEHQRNLLISARNNKDLKLSDSRLTSMRVMEGRFAARLLLDMGGFFDSEEMTDMRFYLGSLEERILALSNTPVTPELLADLNESYLLAIDSCKYYSEHKNPASKSGIARKKMVIEVLEAMMFEQNILTIVAASPEEYQGKKLHEVMGMGRQDNIPELKEPPKTLKLSKAGTICLDILESKKKPSDILAKASSKELKAMTQGFRELVTKLRRFTDAGAHAMTVNVAGENVKLLQKENGSLCIVEGGRQFKLDFTAGLIADNIENDLIDHIELYGRENVISDISAFDISEANLNTGDAVRFRETLITLLKKNTGIERLSFGNIPTESLREYAVGFLSNNKDYTTEKITALITAFEQEHKKQINGAENLELLKKTGLQKENAQNKVDMKKQAPEAHAVKEIEDPTTFTPQQKAYQEMLSDMFASRETWETDESGNVPGARIQKLLKKHQPTLRLFIRDILRTKELQKRLKNAGEQFNKIPELSTQIKKQQDELVLLEQSLPALNQRLSDITEGKLPATEKRKEKSSFLGMEFDYEREVDLASETKQQIDEATDKIKELRSKISETEKLILSAHSEYSECEKLYNNPAGHTSLERFFMKLPITGMLSMALAGEAEEEEKSDLERARSVIDMLSDMMTGGMDTIMLSSDSYDRTIDAGLSATLFAKDSKVAKELEQKLDDMVIRATDSIQDSVTKATASVFPDTKQIVAPDNYLLPGAEEFITDEEKNLLTNKKRLDAQEKKNLTHEINERFLNGKDNSLNAIIKSAASGDSGQGKFFKLVLQSYFKNVDMNTKRSMVASLLREMRPKDAPPEEESEIRVITENNIEEPEIENPEVEQAGMILGALIKGAGPLLQKMIQGMPTVGLPRSIKRAINVTKSQLSHIPDEVVQAQLLGMVERSQKKISRIDKISSLGAASVGEAFLCRMYGPSLPPDGQEVVIKLLRPDVRNRMKQEEDIMLKAAKETDDSEGMLGTYTGMLNSIKEELDLTIEAKNCEAGKVYDGKSKGVQSMKLNDIIKPTMNSIVLEKAPGISMDKYIKELTASFNEALKTFTYINEDGKRTYKKLTVTNYNEYVKARTMMAENLARIQKRYFHLAELSKIWVEEGLFGKGFYHGDLHSGNIMIDDDHATVIDYGNATQLTAVQKDHITKMMAGAAAGGVTGAENFKNSFVALYGKPVSPDEEQKLFTQFNKIFSLGKPEDAGSRIAAALIKAQEIGFALPDSIYKFSQCQMRLQNTMNELKEIEERFRMGLFELDHSVETQSKSDTDPLIRVARKFANDYHLIHDEDNGQANAPEYEDYINNSLKDLDDVNKEELIADVRKTRKVKADKKKKLDAIDERKDFDKKYMNGIAGFKNNLYHNYTLFDQMDPKTGKKSDITRSVKVDANYFALMRQKYYEMYEKYKNVPEAEWRGHNAEYVRVRDQMAEFIYLTHHDDNNADGILPLSAVIPESYYYGDPAAALEFLDSAAFERYMSTLEEAYKSIDEAEKALIALRKEQDSLFPKESRLRALEDAFYEKYNNLHRLQAKHHHLIYDLKQSVWDIPEDRLGDTLDIIKEDLLEDFALSKDADINDPGALVRKELMDKFQTYDKLRRSNHVKLGRGEQLSAEEKKAVKEAYDKLEEAYKSYSIWKLKEFQKGFNIDIPSQKVLPDFVDVMGKVLTKNWLATAKRLGGAMLEYKKVLTENNNPAVPKEDDN